MRTEVYSLTRKDLAERVFLAAETGHEGHLRRVGVVVDSQKWNETLTRVGRLELILEALGVKP